MLPLALAFLSPVTLAALQLLGEPWEQCFQERTLPPLGETAPEVALGCSEGVILLGFLGCCSAATSCCDHAPFFRHCSCCGLHTTIKDCSACISGFICLQVSEIVHRRNGSCFFCQQPQQASCCLLSGLREERINLSIPSEKIYCFNSTWDLLG